jgi:pimeloyl-ACP methyl ester carboxylesterase
VIDRHRPPPTALLVVCGIVAVLCVAAGLALYFGGRESALDAFYNAPDGFESAEPGSLLREEPMQATTDATAYRMLYRTVGAEGQPVVASGFVAWPSSDPPEGGFPIVALGHATVGLADECAPSRSGFGTFYRSQVDAFLDAGFAVAGPDYTGLGPDGDHPYLVGATTGQSVIDAVRAGRESAGDLLSERVVAWGYSQGGHAVLWARSMAEDVAPELEWAGTVALAPVVDLEVVVDSRDLGGVLAVAVLMGREDLGLDADDLLTDAGKDTRDDLEDGCIGTAIQNAEERDEPLLTQDRSWTTELGEDTPPASGSGPALIVYGTEDHVVGTDALRHWVLDAGNDGVEGFEVEGGEHGGLIDAANDQVVEWMLLALAQ